jgi:hypothetical protein
MRLYVDGQYIETDVATPQQKALILAQRPMMYQELWHDDRPLPTKRLPKKYRIYQIWYNEKSKTELDGGFIPYENAGDTHNYENDVILDVWKSREWVNAKYVGVLSWRFHQKTDLISTDLLKDLRKDYDVVTYCPHLYKSQAHPYTREGFKSVTDIMNIVDKYKIFPFTLKNYPSRVNVWCNYWVASPKVFDDYCTNYLNKVVSFFRESDIKEVRDIYEATENHRNGQPYKAMTFFLEGLFSVYLSEHELKIIER